MRDKILNPLVQSYVNKLKEDYTKLKDKLGDKLQKREETEWETRVVKRLSKVVRSSKLSELKRKPYYIEGFDYTMLLTVVMDNWCFPYTKNPKIPHRLSITGLHPTIVNMGRYEIDAFKKELLTLRILASHFETGNGKISPDIVNEFPGAFLKMRRFCGHLPYGDVEPLINGVGELFDKMRIIELERYGHIDSKWNESDYMGEYYAQVNQEYTKTKNRPYIDNEQITNLKEARDIWEEGIRYYYGTEGCGQDLHAALERFKRAAELGLSMAKTRLYAIYFEGIGVEKDKDRALEYLKAAAKEDPEAQGILGTLKHEDGDDKGAFKLYKTAAEYAGSEYMPNYSAQYNYGMFLFKGIGCEKNEAEGLNWIEKAAEGRCGKQTFESGGDRDAQILLAECFESGIVREIRGLSSTPEEDRELANKWYRRSLTATEKVPKACFKVGMYYYDLEGRINEEEVIKYMKMGIDAYNLKKSKAKGSTQEPKHQ